MKKMKLQKGITLIALIITIIILLILAVVTIGSMKESNIITYAQNAADNYKEKAGEENTILDEYVSLIEESISKDKSKEEVSIVGIYGDIDEEYYEFNADGTGKQYFYPNNGTNASFIRLFNYIMQDDKNGILTKEDGTTELILFKFIKNNNGELINKIAEITSSPGTNNEVVTAYTTQPNEGLQKYESVVIYEHVQIIDGNLYTVSFENGKCIGKLENDETVVYDWGNYYKDGDYIFVNDNNNNVFVRAFKINGNELENIE